MGTELKWAYLVVQMDRESIVRELCVLLEHGPDVLQRLGVLRFLEKS
jgi:hypothetical protein